MLAWAALLLVEAAALAARTSPTLHADVKGFTVATFPYDEPAFAALGAWPTEPVAQSTLDGRLKLDAGRGRWRLEAHHEVSAVSGTAPSLGLPSTGVITSAPELVDLTWSAPEDGTGALVITGRTDRLSLQGELGPVTVALGRQPVSFGTGNFFTPMDLVAPFSPATIDTEYKPGVDAARLDAYGGTTFQQTAVLAWVGSCTPVSAAGCDGVDAGDLVAASWSRVTFGVTNLALFLGEIRDDEVVGLSLASAAGPVALHADATLTFPPGQLDARTPDEDVFARVVAGADWTPFGKTTVSGEAYVQTNGAADAQDYLGQATNARYASGELWALGRSYVGGSWTQQLRPTITSNLAVLANVADPSALVLPTLQASVATNAELSVGAFIGLGDRPDGLVLRSEFGLVPVTAFVRLAMYL